jgi:hypothetical protein
MPGIIIPSFPFAGAMVLPSLKLPGLLALADFVCFFTSPLMSTRALFAAGFADLFRVAIFWPLPQ